MQTEGSIRDYLPELEQLADLLLIKRSQSSPVIVCFIGAGASVSAGLPTSSQLMHVIYNELVKNPNLDDPIRELLDAEAKELFKKASAGILRLNLFEFAAVVSQFAYGRQIIQRVIETALLRATHRPLAYELLAHLANHSFIDHFVSLNFDILLDQALEEELPDKLHIISSSDDVPGLRATSLQREPTCFLVKPFGSLANDKYRLRPSELTRYGQDSVWRFLLKRIFSRQNGDRTPDVVLLLVGYAAAEQAFRELIEELKEANSRNITIFSIDPVEKLSSSLNSIDARHIRLEADIAISLLLEIMREMYLLRDKSPKVWTPIARHRIVSQFLSYRQLNSPNFRFKIELILQAVKSRGFFAIEPLGEINRIQRYSSEAHQAISDLLHQGILEFEKWDDQVPDPARQLYLTEDYNLALASYDELSEKVIGLMGLDPNKEMENWRVEYKDHQFLPVREKITSVRFLAEQFKRIGSAPEIEISAHGWPSTRWLFSKPKKLETIDELTKSTADILEKFLRIDGTKLELFGIWVTGEWLFHPEGWAYPFGRDILNLLCKGKIDVSLILVKIPSSDSIRRERAEVVRNSLLDSLGSGSLKIYEMDWWRHNRRVTLLRHRGESSESAEGIYMRRRLASPLVSPVRVYSKDCDVLQRIFERYKNKAQAVEY